MPKCSVLLCSSKAAYHKFPLDEELRRKWAKAMMQEGRNITKWTTICKKHFLPSDYELPKESMVGPDEVRLRLKKNAVPSQFDWPEGATMGQIKQIRSKNIKEAHRKRKLALSTGQSEAQEKAKGREINKSLKTLKPNKSKLATSSAVSSQVLPIEKMTPPTKIGPDDSKLQVNRTHSVTTPQSSKTQIEDCSFQNKPDNSKTSIAKKSTQIGPTDSGLNKQDCIADELQTCVVNNKDKFEMQTSPKSDVENDFEYDVPIVNYVKVEIKEELIDVEFSPKYEPHAEENTNDNEEPHRQNPSDINDRIDRNTDNDQTHSHAMLDVKEEIVNIEIMKCSPKYEPYTEENTEDNDHINENDGNRGYGISRGHNFQRNTPIDDDSSSTMAEKPPDSILKRLKKRLGNIIDKNKSNGIELEDVDDTINNKVEFVYVNISPLANNQKRADVKTYCNENDFEISGNPSKKICDGLHTQSDKLHRKSDISNQYNEKPDTLNQRYSGSGHIFINPLSKSCQISKQLRVNQESDCLNQHCNKSDIGGNLTISPEIPKSNSNQESDNPKKPYDKYSPRLKSSKRQVGRFGQKSDSFTTKFNKVVTLPDGRMKCPYCGYLAKKAAHLKTHCTHVHKDGRILLIQ